MSGQEAPAEYTLRVYKGSDWYWDFQLVDDTTGLPIDITGLEIKLHMQFTLANGNKQLVKLSYPSTGITATSVPNAEFRARINKADLLNFVQGMGTFDFDWRAAGLEERLICGLIEVYDGVDPND